MSLLRPNVNDVAGASNRRRGGLWQSGLCSRCVDGCDGRCEVFQASFRGRELLHAEAGRASRAGDDDYRPLDYSHLNIQGHPLDADELLGIVVSTQAEYGWDARTKMAAPVLGGTLGAGEMGRADWEHLAVGAALSGITLCCGGNVCAGDPELKLSAQGRVVASPEIDRRIATYRRYHRRLGELLLQCGDDDLRLGTAQYVLDKHGLDAIQLAWGRRTSLRGERRSDSLPVALEWQQQGHSVTPNPSAPRVQEAYRDGHVTYFERHRRMGFVDQDAFLEQCDRLRRSGFKRIMLHTDVSGLPELALALKWASLAKIDLLTIGDTAGLGSVSRRHTASRRGMPSLYLHSAAIQFADRLSRKGQRVPDLALTGHFSNEDQLFKVMALGSPYVKAVCIDQALMIPGIVGRNVGRWMSNGGLPSTVSQYGENMEDIFVCWQQVTTMVGKEAMSEVPLGAVAIYCYVQKLAAGLEQLMAGSRSFSLSALRRSALVSLTRECAEVTGIPYVMDASRGEAEAILDG